MNQACPLCEPQKFDACLKHVPDIQFCALHKDHPVAQVAASMRPQLLEAQRHSTRIIALLEDIRAALEGRR